MVKIADVAPGLPEDLHARLRYDAAALLAGRVHLTIVEKRP